MGFRDNLSLVFNNCSSVNMVNQKQIWLAIAACKNSNKNAKASDFRDYLIERGVNLPENLLKNEFKSMWRIKQKFSNLSWQTIAETKSKSTEIKMEPQDWNQKEENSLNSSMDNSFNSSMDTSFNSSMNKSFNSSMGAEAIMVDYDDEDTENVEPPKKKQKEKVRRKPWHQCHEDTMRRDSKKLITHLEKFILDECDGDLSVSQLLGYLLYRENKQSNKVNKHINLLN